MQFISCLEYLLITFGISMEVCDKECMDWLLDFRKVFPKLYKETIHSTFKEMTPKRLGYVSANFL